MQVKTSPRSHEEPVAAFARGLGVFGASLVAQMVKNLPAMRKTWVRSLGWDDPLEEGMAVHSSVLAWRIPGTGKPGGLPSMGLQPRSSVHGILQARILEWVAMLSSRGSSQLRFQTQVSSIAGRFFII